MKYFVFFAIVGLASAATIDYANTGGSNDYEAPKPSGYGGSSGGGGSGYGGGTQTKCTDYFDTITTEHCEPYTERECRTTQRESCVDVSDKKCNAFVTSKQVRKCFNVTELHCSLREEVKYEMIQVHSATQKCHKMPERICDTVYMADTTTKDSFKCINVNSPKCNQEERTIYDKTCRTTTTFDCETMSYGDESGYGSSSGSSGSSSYGSGGSGSSGYGSGGPDSGYGSTSPGSPSYGGGSDDSYGGDSDGYGKVETFKPKCTKRQETKCYNTPRTVFSQHCHPTSEKVCEKFSEVTPYAQAKQNCRTEEKKVCTLDERTTPKQVKKYVYSKQCRSVPRRVCANSDIKDLKPNCVNVSRQQCNYSPVEKCEDIAKKHCFPVTRKVRRKKCEEVSTGGYGDSGSPGGSGYGGGSSGSTGYSSGGSTGGDSY